MDDALKSARSGDLTMLVAADRKSFIFRLNPGDMFQSHLGILKHDDLIGAPWGSRIHSHLGHEFLMFEPTLRDFLLQIERKSQIIFPKDLGYVLLRLSIKPGAKVIEAGTGSGALTTALAWGVGTDGKVFSYDRREDMQELAARNLSLLGVRERVVFHRQDIEQGFVERGVDALFLDLPTPEHYLVHARTALGSGGAFGAIVPTTNQVTALLLALERDAFALVDVCEISLRYYKTVPARLRPTDRMVAHTGYLVFARPLAQRFETAAGSDEEFTEP